ncbi:hypothetical protein [Solitalea lacus]|uniref:hypothetical protein n=1 Tax=Solitalea lacus TaxID=2911172 RepID=UPI001EDB0EBF|nr:hypothetical protein [Solitalea lacus]UKJ08524.1 hypothetical protein L2B55_05015 [Solitalea lacus]
MQKLFLRPNFVPRQKQDIPQIQHHKLFKIITTNSTTKMKALQFLSTILTLLYSISSNAQQPVKYEIAKIAETLILPSLTPKEAYIKCMINGEIDGMIMFSPFYNRINKVLMKINSKTKKQLPTTTTIDNEALGIHVYEDDFISMNSSENDNLQNSTKASNSRFVLAAKMEDPTSKKTPYQNAVLIQEISTQKGITATVEAAMMLNLFTEEFIKKAYSTFETESERKMKELDKKELKTLAPIMVEKSKLINMVGENAPEWINKRLKEIDFHEFNIRSATYETKLQFYRDGLLDLIAAYKRSVAPYDSFLAKGNYGAPSQSSKQSKELAQLANYQITLLKTIVDMQNIAKDITMQSAGFYKKMLQMENTYNEQAQ